MSFWENSMGIRIALMELYNRHQNHKANNSDRYRAMVYSNYNFGSGEATNELTINEPATFWLSPS